LAVGLSPGENSSNCAIGFTARLGSSGAPIEPVSTLHLVGSGLGADLVLPLPQKVDHGLLVPETGVDVPTCHERVSLLRILDECGMTGRAGRLNRSGSFLTVLKPYSSHAWTTVC